MKRRRMSAAAGLLTALFMIACGAAPGGQGAGIPAHGSPAAAPGGAIALKVALPIAGGQTQIEKDLYVLENAKKFSADLFSYLSNETKTAYIIDSKDNLEPDPGTLYPGSIAVIPGTLYIDKSGSIRAEELSDDIMKLYFQKDAGGLTPENCGKVMSLIDSGKDRSSIAFMLEGMCLFTEKKYEESAKAFKEAASKNRYNSQVMLMLAIISKTVKGELTDDAYDLLVKAYYYSPVYMHGYLTDTSDEGLKARYLWKEGRPYLNVVIKEGNREQKAILIQTELQSAPGMIFGMCKAAFRYEPAFRKIGTGKEEGYEPGFAEEFVCYSLAVNAYVFTKDVGGQEKSAFMESLVRLYNEKAMRGFVLVDVLSVYYPMLPLYLKKTSPDLVEESLNYIKKYILPRN